MTPELPTVESLLERMSESLLTALSGLQRPDAVMIGIRTGGVWVARELHARLGLSEPLGALDISFYRDDFSRIGMNPQVRPSELPFAIEDRDVVLVDDVLHTGRTVRAAMNELFDYGRPSSILLAILVDREGRELPVQPDITGTSLTLEAGQHIKLAGPDPLRLTLVAPNATKPAS